MPPNGSPRAGSVTPLRCGVIGHPVAHSRSPEIQHAFAAQYGIPFDFELIDAVPAQFARRARGFFAEGGGGLNVTLPHKAAALALADEADAAARAAGAANVLTRLPGGRLRASNTDGAGFLRDLESNRGFDPAGARVLLLGAGGAAAGLAPALLAADVAALVVHNRTPERARALVERLADPRAGVLSESVRAGPFDLLVNATSASLSGEAPQMPEFRLAPGALAYDLVYADEPTPFMNRMRSLGARAADGWGVLVEQGAESFRLWHGVRPDTAPLLGRRTPPAK